MPQLERPDKGRAIKGLVVCKGWDVNVFGSYYKGLVISRINNPLILQSQTYK